MTTFTIPAPTITERVGFGAAYLDEHVPGWADKIDPAGLDIAKGCSCILGQLFGTFSKGAGYLYGDQAYRAAGHGLDIHTEDDETDFAACDAEFAALTAAWVAVLEARCG